MAELDDRLSLSPISGIQGHTQMKLVKPVTKHFVAFPDDKVLGELNEKLEEALVSIAEQQYLLDFEIFVPTGATRETIGRATKENDAIVRVQVNVYGPRLIAQSVGNELSRRGLYLQRPGYIRDGAAYDNPHFLKLVGGDAALCEEVVHTEEKVLEKGKKEALKKAISDVYSSLTRSQNLKELEDDERLKTPLLQ